MNSIINFIKNNKILFKIFSTLNNLYVCLHNLIIRLSWHIFALFKIKPTKIIFSNFNGGGYGDNPKFIAQKIIDEQKIGKHKDWKLYWVCANKNEDFPAELTLIKPNSLKFVYHMATASTWIDNTRKLYYFKKRKQQMYIQTWHGGPGLKKVEKDCENALSKEYIEFAKIDSGSIDLFLSCCKWCSKLYHTSFWYSNAILEKGIPKNDMYFENPEPIKDLVYSHYSLPRDIKLIMYAPTYRDNRQTDMYNLDCERLITALEEKFNSKFAVLIRLHPNVASKDDIFTYTDKILNASRYANMQELLVACDMIITDYSGCAFDYPMLKKPGFLYAEDYEEMKRTKDYYFSLEELPFSLALNNDELIENIKNFNYNQYCNKCDEYVAEIGYVDNGSASLATIEAIQKHIVTF